MKKFQDWIIQEAENSSNKTKAVVSIVDALRDVFSKYDISTRKKVWDDLSSPKGKELVAKLVKNPKTYLSDSEFVKLIQKTVKPASKK